ncbi:hypothetical protein OHA98_41090 [Streptomyces sp. NBC_00654]|uniref:hypothetical protein n=1 Tax=Streptomyces sp. NBC_00654 TaxID=2975799 RepID=UPI0022536019|nr:hypothetical protein [Streptomyces sp. NBC_00654]MCX4971012.1 hypothetical protein [Streptomyces sp. NBC_00654]
MSSTDIATRVTSGVQALRLDGSRDSWQAQHSAGLLTDAQSYDALADALESDLKQRAVDGDLPWSKALRAKQRAKPLREAARAMRKAAKAINGTVAAYERTDPQQVGETRERKALKKAQRKGQARAIAQNSAARTLERLAPAKNDGEEAGAPQVLSDFFKSKESA